MAGSFMRAAEGLPERRSRERGHGRAGQAGSGAPGAHNKQRRRAKETARDMRAKIVGKAAADEAFRERLLADPKGAIGDELGVTLPASLVVKVLEGNRCDAASGTFHLPAG